MEIFQNINHWGYLLCTVIFFFCFGSPEFDPGQLKLLVIGPDGPLTFET